MVFYTFGLKLNIELQSELIIHNHSILVDIHTKHSISSGPVCAQTIQTPLRINDPNNSS